MERAMASEAEASGGRRRSRWRIAGWGMAALLLLLPLVAMRFTAEVNWTASDFVFAGVLFGGVGLAFELTVRHTANIAYRAGAAVALAGALLTIWVNGAVGMIGAEDNPYNLLFGGVLLIALAGAIAAWFAAAGMARAMLAAAAAQVTIGAIGLSADTRGGVLAMGFGASWLLAAALFGKAAREA
jgi:hypothetical protein